jgi:hypothetical protein
MRTEAILTALGVLAISTSAFADHPCKRVEAACYAAGYAKGAAKQGRGLFKNCVGPLLSGELVPGVSIDPGAVQACAAKKAANHQPPAQPPQPQMPPPKS